MTLDTMCMVVYTHINSDTAYAIGVNNSG